MLRSWTARGGKDPVGGACKLLDRPPLQSQQCPRREPNPGRDRSIVACLSRGGFRSESGCPAGGGTVADSCARFHPPFQRKHFTPFAHSRRHQSRCLNPNTERAIDTGRGASPSTDDQSLCLVGRVGGFHARFRVTWPLFFIVGIHSHRAEGPALLVERH